MENIAPSIDEGVGHNVNAVVSRNKNLETDHIDQAKTRKKMLKN